MSIFPIQCKRRQIQGMQLLSHYITIFLSMLHTKSQAFKETAESKAKLETKYRKLL